MRELQCDVLVIGGGAAGTRAAYEAKKANPGLNVYIVVNGKFETSGSTNIMASEALGINAPLNYQEDGDTPEVYLNDTLQTGGGLGDPTLCSVLADESSDRVRELMDLGVVFAKKDGHIEQQKLSGCTKARSLTCGGSTGQQISGCLMKEAAELGVVLLEDTSILELLKDREGRICGCIGTDRKSGLAIRAKAVILAAGGAGSIFDIRVTPISQTGDGWAMAYKAGCKFVNMEFFQVGPAVVHPNLTFIIHSHMWRFIPKLTNRYGEEFLKDYCKNGTTPEKALHLKAMSYPFSVRTDAKYVDIAIFKEIKAGRGSDEGGIYLDVTHISREELMEKAPITYHTLCKAGIDCAKEPVRITMAVQNFNGGIRIDENGYTGVPGLFAAGEITGGVHGSDRPGGNNLTDTQVFGYRAGKAAAAYAGTIDKLSEPEMQEELCLNVPPDEQKLIEESEKLYYQELTVVRTEEGLQRVLDFTKEHLKSGISLQLRNRLLLGQLFAMAQLNRRESRGTHYREDYPDTLPEWQRRVIICPDADGRPIICDEK